MWMPRRGRDNYPLDLDGSERQTRPKTGIDKFPNVPIIGSISGILRQFDRQVWAQMYAKTPFGPGVGDLTVNLQYQVTPPGLNKYT